MCLLTFFPPGTAPDLGALETGAQVNADGHGFALMVGEQIIVRRGLEAGQLLDEFAQARQRHPQGPALFHSRLATHGTISVGNCHPFRWGRSPHTVVAHNGVLPRRVQPGPYDPRSDTRIAAETYLPSMPFGSLDTHRGRRGLESWLGKSKLVVLTVDPAFAEHAYLFNESRGVWSGGIWYSNTSFRSGNYLSSRSRYSWPSLCECCGDIDVNRRGRYCRRCGWCFSCDTSFPQCECSSRSARQLRLS